MKLKGSFLPGLKRSALPALYPDNMTIFVICHCRDPDLGCGF